MIWVCADLHLNHKNVIHMGRDFPTLEDHNNFVIEQYNKVVHDDDLVYILGDLVFSPAAPAIELVKRLKGRKILILGNHDRLTNAQYREMGIIEVINHPVYYSSSIILSHEPVIEAFNNPYVYNIHGHLHHSYIDAENYINVNIEMNDYKPVDLRILQEKIDKNTKSRREVYRSEWYFPLYKWQPDYEKYEKK